MRTRRTTTIEQLRLAVDCLPRPTRVAMLKAIRANPIIVGAYTSPDGICPMLAAHRAGGRTSCISFAKAWDRFTLAGTKGRPRPATEREIRVLTAHLEMSLLADETAGLSGAIAEHQTLTEKRPARRRHRERPGDPDRSKELRRRGGWAWTRVFRRYDEFDEAVRRAQTAAPRERTTA